MMEREVDILGVYLFQGYQGAHLFSAGFHVTVLCFQFFRKNIPARATNHYTLNTGILSAAAARRRP